MANDPLTSKVPLGVACRSISLPYCKHGSRPLRVADKIAQYQARVRNGGQEERALRYREDVIHKQDVQASGPIETASLPLHSPYVTAPAGRTAFVVQNTDSGDKESMRFNFPGSFSFSFAHDIRSYQCPLRSGGECGINMAVVVNEVASVDRGIFDTLSTV